MIKKGQVVEGGFDRGLITRFDPENLKLRIFWLGSKQFEEMTDVEFHLKYKKNLHRGVVAETFTQDVFETNGAITPCVYRTSNADYVRRDR